MIKLCFMNIFKNITIMEMWQDFGRAPWSDYRYFQTEILIRISCGITPKEKLVKETILLIAQYINDTI